jgi:hypothetical protein
MATVSIKRIPAQSKPLTVRVDTNLERRLQAAAAQEGMSISDFVREAIAERLDRGTADSSLWDRIAPSVVRRDSTGSPRRKGRTSGRSGAQVTIADTGSAASVRRSRRSGRAGTTDDGRHAEFAAGLEAEAATRWRRLDE